MFVAPALLKKKKPVPGGSDGGVDAAKFASIQPPKLES